MKRIVCLSVAIILVSFLIAYESQYFITKKKYSNKTEKSTSSSENSYQTIAVNSLDCFEEKQSLLENTWLLSKLYSKTKISKYYDLLINKIDQLSSIAITSPLKCQMLSDITSSQLLNNDQKELLKNTCLASSDKNSKLDLVEKIKSTDSDTDLDTIFHTKNDIEKKIITESDDTTDITNLAFLSDNLLGEYNFSQKEETLKNSKVVFLKAYKTYLNKANIEYIEACTLASSALSHYRLQNEKLYLEITNDIFKRIENITTKKKLNLSTLSTCANFFTKYFRETNNESAKSVTEFLLKTSLESGFKNQENNALAYDQKCFVNIDNQKPVLENSLLISAFIDYQ